MNSPYNPTAGEQEMLSSFNQRQADINRIAESGGGFNQLADPTEQENAAKTQRWAADDLISKTNSAGTRTEREAYGNALSRMVAKSPTSFSPDVFEEAMRKAGDRTSRREFGQAMAMAFADGGKIDPEELMRQMAAKYGTPVAGPVKQAPAPQPAPQPVVQQQQPGSLLTGASNALRGRAAQIERATAGYAKGGVPGRSPIVEEHASARANRQAKAAAEHSQQGGKIQGPGTATSDSIPAQVRETGENILVSDGERIVSAKQEILLQRIAKMLGFESVDAMLEAGTGIPVGPTLKHGKRAAATGGQFGNEEAETSLAPMNAQATRAGNYPSKLEQMVTGAQVTPAAPNLARGDVGPSKLQQSVAADVARIRGPEQPAPYGNEGRSVPSPITDASKHPVSVPASRAAGAMLLGAEPIDNTQTQPLRTTDIANGGYLDRGAGILAQRGKTGQLNITNIDTGNLTDPRKGSMDDSASALRDQQSNNPYWTPAAQLERMQRRRLETDATDSSITDPRVKADAIRGLAAMNAGQQVEAQAGLQTAQTEQARATTEQMKTIEAMRGKLLDPNTPPEEQKRLERAFVAMRGQAEKPANLQAIDVEEPIDPAQPLLGNRKVPYVFDPRTGQSRPMMQQQQPTDPMTQARAAIARGANKDAVNQRLRQLGLPEVK
jgi:hypothetical protein